MTCGILLPQKQTVIVNRKVLCFNYLPGDYSANVGVKPSRRGKTQQAHCVVAFQTQLQRKAYQQLKYAMNQSDSLCLNDKLQRHFWKRTMRQITLIKDNISVCRCIKKSTMRPEKVTGRISHKIRHHLQTQ